MTTIEKITAPSSTVVCGKEAAQCICDLPPDHGNEPHVCKCGGSWRGDIDGADFEIVALPQMDWSS